MWEKRNDGDQIWWWSSDESGPMAFSFDKKQEFNLWTDYPEKLTAEQKELFDKENPYWANWMKKRAKQ